ncbi:MFS transporter [Thalassospira sp.]|uniref:MFS transporter n=1 Tax=Thalassospira sp. TaxID=1912094 RepID=UPI002733D439|nr:MFS transporter [Thalassospira sp.]MDP2698473.1 MFS transporter [Thalassospira sp.]
MISTPIPKPALSPTSRKQIIVALVLVNLASFVAQIVQIGVMDALIPLAMTDIGLSERAGGLMLALYWLAVLLGGFAAPSLIRRFHPFWLLLISGLTSCALLIGLAFGAGGMVTAVLALLGGFGLILRWAVCDGLIVQLAPKSGVGLAVGIHETLMGLGIALGPVMVSWLGDDAVAMAGFAVVSALVPMLCALLFPRLQMAVREGDIAAGLSRFWQGWHRARQRWRGNADLVVIAFVAGFLEICFLALLPLLAQRDLGLADAGLWLAAVFALGGTLCQPVLGHVSDRFGGRGLVVMCLGVILLCAVPVGLAGYGGIATGVQFMIGAAVAGLYTAAVLLAAARRQPGAAGFDPALLVVVAQSYTLGAIIGPMAGTALLAIAGNAVLPVLALVLGGGAVVMLKYLKMRA